MEDLKSQFIQLLKEKERKHCVLSTVSVDHTPQSAVVGYSIIDDSSFLFNTDSQARKWKNLQTNSHVAIAIGWDASEPFFQCQGVAQLITHLDAQYNIYRETYFQDHPRSLEYKNNPTSVYILVKLTWMRMTDLTQQPPLITEITY